LNILYTFDLSTYQNEDPEDFLYEYLTTDNRWSFFKKALAACL
jgi:hypothetical protein